MTEIANLQVSRTMNTPNIRYYAKMVLSSDVEGGKTPKYTITEQAGSYTPMNGLTGRNGKISMYLLEKLREGLNVPSVWLQAKNSLNFTGLKEYFNDNGELSGYAYGYPYQEPTYSSRKTPNPFYDYRADGFLFLIYQDVTSTGQSDDVRYRTDNTKQVKDVPYKIEMIVLEGAKRMISTYCKMLTMGGFDTALTELRKAAREV